MPFSHHCTGHGGQSPYTYTFPFLLSTELSPLGLGLCLRRTGRESLPTQHKFLFQKQILEGTIPKQKLEISNHFDMG